MLPLTIPSYPLKVSPHDHPHSHEHAHAHEHDPTHHLVGSLSLPFYVGIALNTLFVGVEFFYGRLSHSIALQADAGHNLQDVFSLVLSGLALWLADRPASSARTYGYKKGTILAALIGSVLLVLVCAIMIWEAAMRFADPIVPSTQTMIWVALLGVVINLGSASLLFSNKDHELNARSAYLHLLGDAAISLGVVVVGIIIGKTGWQWLDPVVSVLIAIAILIASFRLLKESLDQAIDGVPRNIDVEETRKALEKINGVMNAHHIHIWGMSTTEIAFTAHLKIERSFEINSILKEAGQSLRDHFHIDHVTLQIEHHDSQEPCADED